MAARFQSSGIEGLRRIMILMIPAVIGLSATQINIFINTNFAARCAEGSVSWLNYAFRLMQFPIGIFGVAISIATLPVIARQASRGDMGSLKATYVSSLTMAFLLTIPASFGLAFLAEPIIRLIFEHGRFNALDTGIRPRPWPIMPSGFLPILRSRSPCPFFMP